MINEIAIAVQANVPIILWGDPGTAKTATVGSIAEVLDWPMEVVVASIREPSDISGLPVMDHDVARGVRLVSPSWAIRLSEEEFGVLFFDELSCAPPANQAALLRVVNERWVGETQLGEGISIIACSNPPSTAAGGWDLPAAQANRFCHLNWTTDEQFKDRWMRGLLAGFPAPSIPRLPKDWKGGIPTQRAIMVAFLRKMPHLIMGVPENESDKGKAWPSPRSWTMAATLSTAARSVGNADAEMRLMMGCVGDGVILEFMAWRKELDLPDPEGLLANPKLYQHPSRGDLAFAILGSVVAAFLRKPTQDRFNASFKVIGRAVEAGGADIAAIHAMTLARNRKDQDGNDLEAQPILKQAEKLAPLLRAAGLVPSK